MTEREFIDNGEMLAPFNGKLMVYDANLKAYAATIGQENYQRLYDKAWSEFYKSSNLEELKDGYVQLLKDMQYTYTAGFKAAWSRFADDFLNYMQCSPEERSKRRDLNEQKRSEMEEERLKFQNETGKAFLNDIPAETVPVFVDIWNSAYAECLRRTLPFYQGMENLLNNLDRYYPGEF